MAKHPKVVTLDTFKGLNNTLRPDRTEPDYFKEQLNLDLDKNGALSLRPGFSQVISGDCHSLWKNYLVKDGDLVSFDGSYTTTALKASVSSSKLSYEEVNSQVFFTGTEESGIITEGQISSFGIEHVNPLPTIAEGSVGKLPNGTYLVAFTYIDATGLEGGTDVYGRIEISDESSIDISNIPTPVDTNITKVRIYCSSEDGEELMLAKDVAIGISTTTISDLQRSRLPLQSFGVYPAPLGHILRYAHSRMWVAEENILHYSEPYSYTWFKSDNYYMFPERITAVMPTAGGMWVSADRLYYLAGKEPSKITVEEKEPIKAVEGTDVKIPGAYVFLENTPIGYKWMFTTDRGMYIAFNDGVVLNMTEKNATMPIATEGASLFYQREGINKYISLLKDADSSKQNMAVSDQATAEIIRNGVTL